MADVDRLEVDPRPGNAVNAPHSRAISWNCAASVSTRWSLIGEDKTVGQIALTVTSVRRHSSASVRICPMTPCLADW